MPDIYDIAVIGAGPGGCSTAITAARRGARVLLIERGDFPRHKVCGEFVSYESSDLVRRLVKDTKSQALGVSGIPLSRARTFVDDVVIETEIRPAAHSIARYAMDQALWDSARELGVDARSQTAVQKVTRNGLFAISSAQGEEFRARTVVNATGRWSNLTGGANSIDPSKAKWVGLKAHFREENPAASMDLHFFNGGYCGVSVVGDSAINVCAMVRADVATKLEDLFHREPRLYERSRNWRPLTDPVTTSPLIFRRPKPIEDGMVLVGDAAAFIDPFAGDGISIALQTGEMAALALLGADWRTLNLDGGPERYTHEYRRRIIPALKNAALIRKLIFVPAWLRKPVLKTMAISGVSERVLKLTRARIASPVI